MTEPRIVTYDLETLPDLMRALKRWVKLSNYPGITMKADLSSIICFGYMVAGEADAHVICAWDFPEWKTNVNDDRALCAAAREILKDADGIVTQNGVKFDEKFLETRMFMHGLDPLPDVKHTDLKNVAKKNLLLHANSLENMAELFTDERKMHNEGWELWVKVWHRDSEAMEKMREYCRQDVIAQNALRLKFRRFMTTLPNQNLFSPLKAKACPNCGSSRLLSNGKRHTATRSYRRYICEDCKHWSHTDIKDEVPR